MTLTHRPVLSVRGGKGSGSVDSLGTAQSRPRKPCPGRGTSPGGEGGRALVSPERGSVRSPFPWNESAAVEFVLGKTSKHCVGVSARHFGSGGLPRPGREELSQILTNNCPRALGEERISVMNYGGQRPSRGDHQRQHVSCAHTNSPTLRSLPSPSCHRRAPPAGRHSHFGDFLPHQFPELPHVGPVPWGLVPRPTK